MPMKSITKERTYLFEKLCLRVGERCKHAAYAFEVFHFRKLHVKAIRELTAVTLNECLNACLDNSRCFSVNYVRSDRFCQINQVSHRTVSGQFKKNLRTSYYENNCVHEEDRCGDKRIEYVMSRNHEVLGKDISVGIHDIRTCMRECIESSILFCRSFEFDTTTNECFISEEDSALATPSGYIFSQLRA
ncbi:unnamed protein product [Anisakis simplex]|uniref:Apple domain-containing protein n=1 Tax=Anisakis simplex TaxID=6269 RepID=A0A0M3J493_ANISI|nr:unnamed protein product [Anisakis simplex]